VIEPPPKLASIGKAMSYPLVYTVVLTWNGRADTLECLPTVLAMPYPNMRVVLVDNASTDGTVPAVREAFPGVEILVNKENLGFAGGTNTGVRYALERQADYVFLLNNDVTVAEDTLGYLIQVAESEPDVGVLTPRIYYYYDHSRLWSVGGRKRPFTLAFTDPDINKPIDDVYHGQRNVDYVLGCGMLVRSEVFRTAGLLDEAFIMCYEDLDFCLRVKRAGWRLVYVPQAKMWHKVLASAQSDPPLRRYQRSRDSIRFFKKHTRKPLWPFIIVYRLGSAMRVFASEALAGNWDKARAHVRGLYDGLRWPR